MRIKTLFYKASSRLLMVLVILASVQVMSEEATPKSGQDKTPDQTTGNRATRTGSLDLEQQTQLTLSQEVQSEQLVWLDVRYPEQEEVMHVLALEQKPRSPLIQGAVLLLHDKEQHADWPQVIRPLRLNLPDAGWYTLSVNLPYDDAPVMPERTIVAKKYQQIVLNDNLQQSLMKRAPRETVSEAVTSDQPQISAADETASDSATTEQSDLQEKAVDIDLADRSKNSKQTLPYRDRAIHHIQAAMDHIRNAGYQNIVLIAYRAAAELALDHIKPIAQQIPEQGFALMMIDPLLQRGYQGDLSQALGRDFRAPVLDMFNGADLSAREAAEERESSARMANALRYQQARLITSEGNALQESLIQRVRLWLQKNAPGMSATQTNNRR